MPPQTSNLRGLRSLAQFRNPLTRRIKPMQRRFASSENSGFKGAEDNAFNRERKAVKDHATATSDLWRKLSIYVVTPALILASVNAYNLWNEHWHHWEHMQPLEKRTQYSYQNIRSKNYFWGDGDKTAFWNPEVNYNKKD